MRFLDTNATSMMLVLTAGQLFSGLLVIAYATGMALKGALQYFLIAKLVQTGAWAAFGLQPFLPDNLIGILLPNTLLYTGFALEMGSFLRLVALDSEAVRQRFRWLTIASVLTFILASLLLDRRGRIIVSSFTLAVLLGYPTLLLLLQARAATLQRVVMLTTGFTCVLLFARGVAALVTSMDFSLQINSAFNTGMFLVLYIHLLSGSMGFILIDKQRLDAELTQAATTDGLTGILIRQAFEARAGELLALCARRQEPVSCLLMDVDNFKQLNDRHGHLAGDAILRGVAVAVGAHLRRDDLFGRYGGEEFAILLPGTREDQALAVAQRLRTEVEGMRVEAYETVGSTVSIGVSTLTPGLDTGMQAFYARSDQALYLAKAAGKNCVIAG